MIVRVGNDKNTPTLRPGMWLVDRDGKRWQWSVLNDLGTLADGNGAFLDKGGAILWYTHEVATAIERGELTTEPDAVPVQVGTLPVNAVFSWGCNCWQVEGRNMIGKPSALDSVRVRVWPNLVEGKPSFIPLDPSTHVTPLGVPVVEEKP